MRQSNLYIPTLREVPADAEAKSHQLLVRAGFIRQSVSGVYSFLPLGRKVLKKVESIIREEMDEIGSQEVLMPALQPSELWEESGRWQTYGPELMRLNDRHDRTFALGATHEELITSLVRDEVKSYKRLPMVMYQIQAKFRDEKRPRFGLLRGREFIMKDAYTFDMDYEGLDENYDKIFNAYKKIFERCNLNFRAVIADSGAMGGKDTHEFMVLADIGEDTIAYSNESDFAANIEMAPVNIRYNKKEEASRDLKKVETVDQKTIQDVSDYLNVSTSDCIKAILWMVDEKPVLVLARGDHEINDIKVKNVLDAEVVELASEEQTKHYLGCETGYLGPIGISSDVQIIADHAVASIVNGVCGANERDTHYQYVNPERDFEVDLYEDLRFIQEGDPSPDGKGTITFAKGIEVGHVFKLGTKYSESLGANILDQNGKSTPIIMGSYGIGVSRTMAAVVEQMHDDNGIVWPTSLSPFDAHVICVNPKNDAQSELGERLYKKLKEKRFDVLYDDRKERAGVKFTDADLIGVPVQIIIGKRADEGIVEVKDRRTSEKQEMAISEIEAYIEQYYSNER
ncbi:proline--tRNA ligase [Pseudalkalibacillus berkeleyi]|uniref:Proline--tRNA ligase n=1 Tax=Pseudalkalibacillus berkeleyi TaxID=1069813 RepID=A0ABS9GWH5_9BACL|nr:proline--tRNA ligase [Pseudalkalibacillus berkeleyi]MCF6137143.1 proline--tRNA ligase [Pseudalkalibacillus berkeleyi]